MCNDKHDCDENEDSDNTDNDNGKEHSPSQGDGPVGRDLLC